MIIQKIAKFEKHTENSYSVWYEGTVNQQVCMNRARFELAKCVDEFLRRAIDPKDIQQLINLTIKWFTGEFA